MRVSANFLLGALVSSACLPGAEIAAEGAAEPVPGGPAHPGRTALKFGRDDGALLALEAGRAAGSFRKLALGAWAYPADFAAIGEASLVERVAQNVGGWLRAGVADDQFNDFRGDVGAGVSAAGLVPGRPDDQLAFAVASVQGGAPWRDAQALAGAPVDPRETTVELTWRMPVNDWLTLQPDFQCVINPGLSAELDHAVVADLRFEFGTSWAR